MSKCDRLYGNLAQDLLLKIHMGLAKQQELDEIAGASQRHLAQMSELESQLTSTLSIQDRQQERLDGIEAYKAKAKTIDEVTGIELVG